MKKLLLLTAAVLVLVSCRQTKVPYNDDTVQKQIVAQSKSYGSFRPVCKFAKEVSASASKVVNDYSCTTKRSYAKAMSRATFYASVKQKNLNGVSIKYHAEVQTSVPNASFSGLHLLTCYYIRSGANTFDTGFCETSFAPGI